LTTLVDTSAWVEFLRSTGSDVNVRVRSMIDADERLATTDVVIMELLCGAGVSDHRTRIWGLMNRCSMLPTRPLFDYEIAAELYTRCRRDGFHPANTNDLLIASVAIGKKVPLLAADTDFERIAAVSSLRLAAD
jgi:predicted nucleic acid-binding protein